MNITRWGLVLLPVGWMLAGCAPSGMEAYKRYELGPARETIVAAVEQIGGVTKWKQTGRVEATALVTIYDNGGQAHVNRQVQRIDVLARRIEAEANTPRGTWLASYRCGGKFKLTGAAALEQISPDQLRDALAMIAERAAGPLNLLDGPDRPGSSERVWVHSKHLVRVGVTGTDTSVVAYYFDADSGLLSMVTAGSEQPGRDGTVSLYTYQMLQNGMMFPKTIRVVRTGRHVQVGETPIFEVTFSEVKIR